MRNIFKSKDSKPTEVAFVLMQDPFSRWLGRLAEREWKDGDSGIFMKKSNGGHWVIDVHNIEGLDLMKVLVNTANEVGGEHGIQTALILR